jgi:phospholipid/cholesterol/gamma-HCH transport system ATP-binding protein
VPPFFPDAENLDAPAPMIRDVQPKKPLIRVQNISKRYTPDGPLVLKDISFEVYAGEAVAIIGTSGCGKSTLLRCLAGLEDISGGSIEMQDPNFTLIFQYSALFDSLNVRDNIAFALTEKPDTPGARKNFKAKSASEIDRIVAEKLEMVGLAGIQNQYPNELSGGMQKRVSFARGIVSNPRIILYDEPTSGLDPVASHDLEDYMNLLGRQLQAASVVVTHTISTICRTANRVILLNKGNVHWQGTPQELLRTQEPLASQFAAAALDTER